MAGMPSRGISTAYPAPPLECTASGLIGLSPIMPVPWSIVIFSSMVISLTTIEARSSGERLGFIHGCGLPPDCAAAMEMSEGMKSRDSEKTRHNFTDGLCRGIELTSRLYKIDIV